MKPKSSGRGMGREELQRALGVKPMDKSSQFKGVSKKKGKWEAKVSALQALSRTICADRDNLVTPQSPSIT